MKSEPVGGGTQAPGTSLGFPDESIEQPRLRVTAVDQVSLGNIEMQLSNSPISLTHKMTDSMTQGRWGKWPNRGSEMSISWTWGPWRKRCGEWEDRLRRAGTVPGEGLGRGSRHRSLKFNGRQKAAA